MLNKWFLCLDAKMKKRCFK